jgi:arylsulfatase
VLPLDDRSIELFFTRYRDRSVHPTDRRYTYYPPMAPLPAQVAPSMGGRGFDLAATIDRPAGAGGVLFATGTENSGLSVFVQGDRLVFDYNCFNDHYVVDSSVEVPVGPSVVGVRFRRAGAGGTAGLFVDGIPCGDMTVPFAMHIISSVGPSVGYDHGSPVSERYSGHFPFEGTLHEVDIAVVHKGTEAAETLESQQRAAMSQQ